MCFFSRWFTIRRLLPIIIWSFVLIWNLNHQLCSLQSVASTWFFFEFLRIHIKWNVDSLRFCPLRLRLCVSSGCWRFRSAVIKFSSYFSFNLAWFRRLRYEFFGKFPLTHYFYWLSPQISNNSFIIMLLNPSWHQFMLVCGLKKCFEPRSTVYWQQLEVNHFSWLEVSSLNIVMVRILHRQNTLIGFISLFTNWVFFWNNIP